MSNILLIHGAWGRASEFDEVVGGLTGLGHDVRTVDLPGHGDAAAPIAEVTMAAYVARVVEALDEIEGPVVLVGHSLAGATITQVAQQVPNKIERLVYVTAFLPKDGETALGLMQGDTQGQILPKIEFSDDQSYATLADEHVRKLFLHDVKEPERVDAFAPVFAIRQANEPFMAPARLTQDAFGSVPKFYVRATLDRVLSLSLQDQMLTSWPMEQVFTLESGHFPLMSVPDQLVQVLSQAAQAPIASA